MHQTAVAQPRPTTYELLFPLNGQPARIEVIASDEKTGRTLAAQPLQNPASFLPAGRVPMRLLGPNEFLLGISGEIGDALRLQAQVNRAGLAAGVLDPIRLPANFIGYDGVSALVLVAADLAELKPEQEQAILQWVRRGGNLVFIPGTRAMPSNDDLVEALPCEIGVNRMVGGLNGRELSPRAGAAAVKVMDHTGYKRRWGLGYVLTLPMDIAPVQFAEANAANTLWRSMLAGMVRVPPTHEPTEMVLSDEQDILIGGPNAADSVGRGQRESVAIRHVLELLGATGSEPPVDWRRALMWMAGIFLLVGPVDSIILMRLGQTPRNWVTIVGWVGLLASVGTYAAIRPADSPTIRRSLRLVDQVDDSMVAATDIIAVNSRRAKWARMKLDENEWWEPANQAARSFGPERFVDAVCREDRNGCRPEWIRLTGGEAQAWHGETAGTGRAVVAGEVELQSRSGGQCAFGGEAGECFDECDERCSDRDGGGELPDRAIAGRRGVDGCGCGTRQSADRDERVAGGRGGCGAGAGGSGGAVGESGVCVRVLPAGGGSGAVGGGAGGGEGGIAWRLKPPSRGREGPAWHGDISRHVT